MTIRLIRATVKPEFADVVHATIGDVFAAIERDRPAGVRYASYRLPDGVTYLAYLSVDEGLENPLVSVPEFLRFQEALKEWLVGPPTIETVDVIGSYAA